MPIYEYYCTPCHTIFSFLAKSARVSKEPVCPRCGGRLRKQVTSCAFSQKMRGTESLPFSAKQAHEGVKKLKNEIDRLKSEETPQRAEQFKKKFERWSGVKLDHSISTLRGVELAPDRGEPPEEENAPARDETIYEL